MFVHSCTLYEISIVPFIQDSGFPYNIFIHLKTCHQCWTMLQKDERGACVGDDHLTDCHIDSSVPFDGGCSRPCAGGMRGKTEPTVCMSSYPGYEGWMTCVNRY